MIVAEFPAVLALGSNLGDREATLRAAVGDIAAIPGVVLLRASGLVETPALKADGVDPDAPTYLNAVVAVRSALGAHELLHALAGIEAAHGRVRDVRWGDRTLDIDIVNFGGQQLETDELTIPHPRAAGRVFVLAPWLQIDPSAVLPGIGPIAPLLADLLAASGETVSPYPAEPLT